MIPLKVKNIVRGVALLVPWGLFVMAALPLAGMSRSGHIREWDKVLGIEAQPGNSSAAYNIKALYNEFSDAIDANYSGLLDRLKEITRNVDGAQEFAWSRDDSHAVFFHWPFSAEPKDHTRLMKLVKRCRLPREKEQECMDIIGKEWEKRREGCLSAVRKRLGVSEPEDVEAIATIIHDTHILADYIENTKTGPLAPIKSLKSDLLQNGLKVLARGSDDLLARSDQTVDLGDTLHNKVAAEMLVANLSGIVPQLLEHQCGGQLAAKGIQVVTAAPSSLTQSAASGN